MHSHSDNKIKTCEVCQRNLRETAEAYEELNKLGTWTFHKKALKKGGPTMEWNPKC